MFYTDNPLQDFMNHDAQQEAELDKLPVCADCGHRIQDDYYYEINGECICQDCLDSNYRKDIDDYI